MKTFGVSLEELLNRNPDECGIPKVVKRITDFIKCHGRHIDSILITILIV